MREIYLRQNNKIKRLEEKNTNLRGHKQKFYKRIENLTNIQFAIEETNLLKKGLNYNLHQEPKNWIENIALEAETAIE
jgi:23S rRNA maturation mini-RNase III